MKKRVAMALAGTLVVLLALSACTKKPTAALQPQSGNLSTLDFNDLGQKLSLNGERVSLPCTLEDLGEGYYFMGTKVKAHFEDPQVNTNAIVIYSDAYETDIEDDGAAFNKVTAIVVDPDGDDEGEIFQDSPITGLFAYSGGEVDFIIDRVGFDSTKEEVVKTFGQPTTIGANEEIKMEWYTYISPGTGHITVAFEDEKVQKLEFLNYKNTSK